MKIIYNVPIVSKGDWYFNASLINVIDFPIDDFQKYFVIISLLNIRKSLTTFILDLFSKKLKESN